MSEGDNAVVWQCVHCHSMLPGVPPGSLPYCPFCCRSTPKLLPDVSGVTDRPGINHGDSEANELERSQKQTTKSDAPSKLPKRERNKEDTRKEQISKVADSKQERTPPSQRHIPPVPKQKPTANANLAERILQPAKLPSQQMGGSHAGSAAYTALTRLALKC